MGFIASAASSRLYNSSRGPTSIPAFRFAIRSLNIWKIAPRSETRAAIIDDKCRAYWW